MCDNSNDPDRHLLDESARRKICEAWKEADLFWYMWFKGGMIGQLFQFINHRLLLYSALILLVFFVLFFKLIKYDATFFATIFLVIFTYEMVVSSNRTTEVYKGMQESSAQLAKATKTMADATLNMAETYKSIQKSSERSIRAQSAIAIIQMINAADTLAIQSVDIMKVTNEIIKDDEFDLLFPKVEKINMWVAFVWLNIQQANIFLQESLPAPYLEKRSEQVLKKMLELNYVRYLVVYRGYYEIFIEHCKNVYSADGREWDDGITNN